MPAGWTPKDERQKKHIEASERAQGRSPAKAKQIGFATVNKERSAQGRTKAAKRGR